MNESRWMKWNEGIEMKELKLMNWHEWIEMNEVKWRNWNEGIHMKELELMNWHEGIEVNESRWMKWNERIETNDLKGMNWNEWIERKELPKVLRNRQCFTILYDQLLDDDMVDIVWNQALTTVPCAFRRRHLQKVVSDCQVLRNLCEIELSLQSRAWSRRSRAHFVHLMVQKWSGLSVFIDFYLKPSSRECPAYFVNLIFQKWSETVSFLSFFNDQLLDDDMVDIWNQALTTVPCPFCRRHLPKVVWSCHLFTMFFVKSSSRYSTFCRPHRPKAVRSCQCSAIFFWNRALTTVSCTFCRPHLLKVVWDPEFFLRFYISEIELSPVSCTCCRPLSRIEARNHGKRDAGFCALECVQACNSRVPNLLHFPTTWWWCGWHDNWDDDVVAKMVGQLVPVFHQAPSAGVHEDSSQLLALPLLTSLAWAFEPPRLAIYPSKMDLLFYQFSIKLGAYPHRNGHWMVKMARNKWSGFEILDVPFQSVPFQSCKHFRFLVEIGFCFEARTIGISPAILGNWSPFYGHGTMGNVMINHSVDWGCIFLDGLSLLQCALECMRWKSLGACIAYTPLWPSKKLTQHYFPIGAHPHAVARPKLEVYKFPIFNHKPKFYRARSNPPLVSLDWTDLCSNVVSSTCKLRLVKWVLSPKAQKNKSLPVIHCPCLREFPLEKQDITWSKLRQRLLRFYEHSGKIHSLKSACRFSDAKEGRLWVWSESATFASSVESLPSKAMADDKDGDWHMNTYYDIWVGCVGVGWVGGGWEGAITFTSACIHRRC